MKDIYEVNVVDENGCIAQYPLIFGRKEAESLYKNLMDLGYEPKHIFCVNLTKYFEKQECSTVKGKIEAES